MTNPCLKGMVKIGYARNVETRRKQLSTTALPTDYEIYATYETQGNLEDKKLHKLIDNLNPDLRVSKSRVFFVMEPEEAYELLESIAIISGSTPRFQAYTLTHYPYTFRICLSVTLCLILPRFAIKCTYCRMST